MSEDFDREAEREKLRKKYERDKKKREATEQMSELLLQGATMTNAHCSECGDPIFRYEGQEFCPTCERPVDREQQDEQTEDEPSDRNDSEQIEVTTPSDGTRVAFGEDGSDETTETQTTETQTTEAQTTETQPPTESETVHAQSEKMHAGSEPTRESQHTGTDTSWQPADRRSVKTPADSDASETIDAGVETARAALVQTLTRFSQQAAATEDPHRAKEYLEAAREAADALAALRR